MQFAHNYTTLQEFADKHKLNVVITAQRIFLPPAPEPEVYYFAEFDAPITGPSAPYRSVRSDTPLKAIQSLIKVIRDQQINIRGISVIVPDTLIYVENFIDYEC